MHILGADSCLSRMVLRVSVRALQCARRAHSPPPHPLQPLLYARVVASTRVTGPALGAGRSAESSA